MGWLGSGCTGAAGCSVTLSGNATVSATFAPSTVEKRIDIDGNSAYEPLTDGLLMIRYLFGLTGNALTNGAIGGNPARSSPADILQRLNDIRPLLDVNGNGQADALTDGLMLIRYLFSLRGAALINGAVAAGATRTTAPDIEAYIRTLFP